MTGHIRRLGTASRGAVAPTVALSLFALIGAGGIAFDYARLATLDTELQNAADQAALAAATQLDGTSGAMARAEAAARGLLVNQTRFANDGAGLAVTVPAAVTLPPDAPAGTPPPAQAIKFYASRDDAEADTNGWFSNSTTAGHTDNNAKFVRVAVTTRRANYALTPVVGALASGNIAALATAGLGSSICKVPPVMLCNPDEPVGNTNELLTFNPPRGTGMRLVTGSASVPGNFGWLEAGLGNGTPELAAALGYNSPPGECQPVTGVTTKTGMDAAVLNAFNTRFDVYANGNTTCPGQGGGTCSPSPNTRKDLVCDPNNTDTECNNGVWTEASTPYRLPNETTTTTQTVCNPQGNNCRTETVTTTTPVERALLATDPNQPLTMGYPRDYCHMWPRDNATCGGANIKGSGNWDRNAYFRVNYGWDAATWPTRTGLNPSTTTVSRYDVYKWELAHPAVLQSDGVTACTAANSACRGIAVPKIMSNTQGAFSVPANGFAGVAASSSQADRRKISVAVLNCRALTIKGKSSGLPVPTWLEVFLVEPAINRGQGSTIYTDQKDIYVEMVGTTLASGAGGAGQVVRRDVPYLIR